MIQFIKFACIDPEGYMLVKLDDISSFSPTSRNEITRLVTCHGEFLLAGTTEYFIDTMRSYIGSEWDFVPEDQPTNV